jgi:hypothetical protein
MRSNRLLSAMSTLLMLSCSSPERKAWENTFTGTTEDAFLVDDDFACLADARWQLEGHTRLWNPLGHTDDMMAVARGDSDDPYPVGTVLQLFPGEASVKRGAGFSPDTKDWEFLIIDADSGKTVITERGTTAIENVAGSCIGCHAASTNDTACFRSIASDTAPGCEALPFFISTDTDPKNDDPRCR